MKFLVFLAVLGLIVMKVRGRKKKSRRSRDPDSETATFG